MIEGLLQEATGALLAQQEEIERLHSVVAWCRGRLQPGEARQVDAMLRARLQRQMRSTSGRAS